MIAHTLKDLIKQAGSACCCSFPLSSCCLPYLCCLHQVTPHRNDYGDVRPSTTWEKLLAGIMIILSILMMLFIFVFFYYFASPDLWEGPTQIIQNTTGYF